MTLFVQSIICWYICLVVYSIIDSIKINKKEEQKPNKREIWQHPLLVEAGIKKPLEEIDLEEVRADELPMCWKIRYNERKDDYTTILDIEEKTISCT